MSNERMAEKLARVYLKIRAEKSRLSTEYREKERELNAQLDKLKIALLDYCTEIGADSVRTSEGLFYRTTKTKYWTSDWEEMHKFILEHQVPEFFEKRLNQKAVKEFLEENPEVVPKGLNVDSEYVISVRKPK
jgi:hypothetical protein